MGFQDKISNFKIKKMYYAILIILVFEVYFCDKNLKMVIRGNFF